MFDLYYGSGYEVMEDPDRYSCESEVLTGSLVPVTRLPITRYGLGKTL